MGVPRHGGVLLSSDGRTLDVLLTSSLHRHKGFRMFRTGSRSRAAGTLRQRQPRILLLSFLLPRGNNFRIVRRLHRSKCGVSAVFVATLPAREIVRRTCHLNTDFILPGPFATETLIRQVRSTLRDSQPWFTRVGGDSHRLGIDYYSPE